MDQGARRETGQGAQPGQGAQGQASSAGQAQRGWEEQGQGSQAAQGTSTPRSSAETPQTTSENELCAALTREGKLSVEDVKGGAAIVVKPRTSGDLTMVRQRAQDINQRLGQNVGSAPGASCELFSIARSGASTAVSETPESVRILITTTDPSQVHTIRKEVREFVNKSATGAQGKHGAGSQGGHGTGTRGSQGGQGSQGGSQGSQGGSKGTGSQTPHKGGGQ